MRKRRGWNVLKRVNDDSFFLSHFRTIVFSFLTSRSLSSACFASPFSSRLFGRRSGGQVNAEQEVNEDTFVGWSSVEQYFEGYRIVRKHRQPSPTQCTTFKNRTCTHPFQTTPIDRRQHPQTHPDPPESPKKLPLNQPLTASTA